MGSFPASSPAPYTDQVRLLAQMMSGASAVPERFFGFVTAQPPSAEALAGEEARLVKRAERRQSQFSHAWSTVGWLAARMQGAELNEPEFHQLVRNRWRDASTPTRAATADAVTKLVGAGVLPADSRAVLEMLDFDDQTINAVLDHRAAQAPTDVAALAQAITRQHE
nr:phage portal protein [uncultured Tessaracoccus sp.]